MIELRLKKNEFNEPIFVAYGQKKEFTCNKCQKQVNEGYICENNAEMILCIKCQEQYNMSRCKHSKFNEHKHIKFKKAPEKA